MNILEFLTNNPLSLILGLLGTGLIIASTIFSKGPEPVRQPVRIEDFHKK